MTMVNTREARAHWSRLVKRAAEGETIIIARAGKPVARLVPLDPAPVDVSRRLGFMEGDVKIPEDFDRMMEDEIAEMFNGPEN